MIRFLLFTLLIIFFTMDLWNFITTRYKKLKLGHTNFNDANKKRNDIIDGYLSKGYTFRQW